MNKDHVELLHIALSIRRGDVEQVSYSHASEMSPTVCGISNHVSIC